MTLTFKTKPSTTRFNFCYKLVCKKKIWSWIMENSGKTFCLLFSWNKILRFCINDQQVCIITFSAVFKFSKVNAISHFFIFDLKRVSIVYVIKQFFFKDIDITWNNRRNTLLVKLLTQYTISCQLGFVGVFLNVKQLLFLCMYKWCFVKINCNRYGLKN